MKTNPYEITISAEMLFSGWQSAGIDGSSSHSERMAWENKSQSDKVLSVLEFISNRAEAICAHDNDDIADIKSVAQRVLIECDRVKNGEMLALVRLGARMETMKTLLAANKAIEFNVKLTARSIKGGNNSGKARQVTAKQREAEIVKHWKNLTGTEERYRASKIEARLAGTEFACSVKRIREVIQDANLRS